MGAPKIDHSGKVVNGISILSLIERRTGRDAVYRFRCHCGKEWQGRIGRLFNSRRPTKGCGCHKRDKHINFTHDMSSTQIYHLWNSMKERCSNVYCKSYPDYGGRGITVCDRWKSSFANFYADMGDKPPGMSLNRVDNDGNYEPGNCQWANKAEQNKNRRLPRKFAGFRIPEFRVTAIECEFGDQW